MGSGERSTHVAIAIALAVVAAGAVGGVAGETGGTVIEATDPSGAERPANATVTYGYVSGTSGNVTLATANGTQIDTGVSAVVAGQGGDLDGDGNVEVPYVTGQQTLGVVDRTGETTHLADAAEETQTKMAIGDLNGDGEPRVYYARDSSTAGSELRWANASGGTGVVASKDTTAMGALGVADVTGDGVDELVFVGSSTGLRYYNESAGEVVKFYTSGIGSNGGLGVGAPRDFDGDGVAETPIVDGSNNALLIDADGSTTTVVTGGVDKSPVAGVEVDSAEGLELLYATGNDVKYATMDGDTGRLTDADGNDVATTDDAGVAWLNAPDDPFTVESLSLTTESRNLTLSIRLSEEAETLDATVSGPDSRSFDRAAFDEREANGSWTYTTTYRPNETGEYTATVDGARSVDGDETTSDETATATVDATSPLVVNATLADATDGNAAVNASDRVRVAANVSDDVETVTADLSAFDAGTVELTAGDAADYSTTVDVENGSEGRHAVPVTAADGQGNEDTATTGDVALDTTPPSVSVGEDRTVTANTTVSLSADASDGTTRVVDQGWTAESAPDADGSRWSGSFESPGEYELRFAATDAAGNSETSTVNVTVEETTTSESQTETAAPTPSSTPTPTGTADDTPTATPASEPGDDTPTATPSGTPDESPTATPAASPTETATDSPTETVTPQSASTPTTATDSEARPVPQSTATETPTAQPRQTATDPPESGIALPYASPGLTVVLPFAALLVLTLVAFRRR